MGLFSFGGSKSDSSSRSFSNSFDNLDSFGFDFGFDTSASRSTSGGQSSSADRSSQSVSFGDVFGDLFRNASDAAGGIDTGNLSEAANLLFSSGGDIISNLEGGGAGAEHLEERLASRDGLADEQIANLGDDLSRFLSEDVSGAITSSGVSAGTLGGSRGEVQAGIAERGAAEAFVRGSTDIRQRDQTARDRIASELMASESERGATALSGLEGLFGLAEAGTFAELSPMLMLSEILGPQLALTESEGGSQSTQFADALAEALGFNIGGNQTTGRAGSSSGSSSSSSSRSLSLGLE